MNAEALIVVILLASGVAIQLICCVGVLLFRGAFARLHCVGPATTLAPMFIVAAVLVHHSSLQACVKVILIAGAFLLINPVLTHVTAQAEHVRHAKHVDPEDGDIAEDA